MTGPRGGGRVYLEVSYSEREQAKALGARWDPAARRWWAPPAATAAQQRWPARPEVPALLPGEDRTFGAGLFVDMIPTGAWFTQIRTAVSGQDWERLRRMLERRAGGRCEICQAGPDPSIGRPMEAHERFAYDEATNRQVLTRLLWICSDCHQATHFGLAEVRGQRDLALAHLRAVTGMSAEQAEAHIAAAYAVWRTRSDRYWRLDLAILARAPRPGAPPAPPPPPAPPRPGPPESHLQRLRPASAGGPARDEWDGGEQDADDLNAYYAPPDAADRDGVDEGCGGVSVRAVSVDDAPAYLEALLHGRDPFASTPPADDPRTTDQGDGPGDR
ncbi:MAG: DUF5710 domain-containing protein, partial [Pseudonocardia sp.]|nr:DUF5710 domain-containing protein [Pseudonocardia sp.]